MHSSTADMVEKKVLEMAQHASFHQHVSYNLSTILHALTAGKTDPAEIAAVFSRAKGLEVITRVITGEPVARPAVVSLCCGVARRVIDKFGPGVTEPQAEGLAEALVARLDRGIFGDDAQTMDCQVECARLMSSIAGRNAATLLAGGALGAVEEMLERLAGKHRSAISQISARSPSRTGSGARHSHVQPSSFFSETPPAGNDSGIDTSRVISPTIDSTQSTGQHLRPSSANSRAPSIPIWWIDSTGYPGDYGVVNSGPCAILQPCCETLERVSRSHEGKAALEERGTAGVLLATIRDCPEALEEGSDAALAPALKVIETIFSRKNPEECVRSLRDAAPSDANDGADGEDTRTSSVVEDDVDVVKCVETLVTVAEASPAAPGTAAATCLWWVAGASDKVTERALNILLVEALAGGSGGADMSDGDTPDANGCTVGLETEEEAEDLRAESATAMYDGGDGWARLLTPRIPVESGEEADEASPALVESAAAIAATVESEPLLAARFLAALCLCKPGLSALGSGVRRRSPRAVEALVELCDGTDPQLARSCFRIVERLAGELGAREFVNAGVFERAADALTRFERSAGGTEVVAVGDAEVHAIAAALGAVAALGKVGGKSTRRVIDDAFRVSVRCLTAIGEFSGRPAAAVAKAALDVITFRLTRSDRARTGPKGAIASLTPKSDANTTSDSNSNGHSDDQDDNSNSQSVWQTGGEDSTEDDGVDKPMEILKDGGAILATMKAHPTDARVQESGWRSLIAMDTGRGDVERFLVSGDGQERGREMLRDCIKRHGGDSAVAGQVAAMLERLVFQGDSEGGLGEHTDMTASPLEEADDEGGWSGNSAEEEEVVDSAPTAPTDEFSPTNGSVPTDGSAPTDACVSTVGSVPTGGSTPTDVGRARADSASGYVEDKDADGNRGIATEDVEIAVDSAGNIDDCEAGRTEEKETESLVERIGAGSVGDADGFAENATAPNVDNGGELSHPTAEDQRREPIASPLIGERSPGGRAYNPEAADLSPVETPTTPEDILAHLSRIGQRALLGAGSPDCDSSSASPGSALGVDEDAKLAAAGSTALARSLFSIDSSADGTGDGEKGEQEVGGEAVAAGIGDGAMMQQETTEEMPPILTEVELRLEKSWTELERLHGDVAGRSQIIGGECADLVAFMPDPSVLRREIGATLQETSEARARGAIAASHLAMVGALTAATDALASSQREVQRYLTMSRDLRGTSTWKDMAEAMQWTMDSLKGTVILFTPHTSQGMTKDLGLCKNSEAAASKLFKEAALNIKIVVVELAGETAPNTVWRIPPGKFESLPDYRKIMMLRHLRSLVVAYDNLTELSRQDLTTALEIIKNREVLNRMGKCCVEAEALDEQRSKARIAAAEEKLRVGTRRASGTRASYAKRSPPPSMKPGSDTSTKPSSPTNSVNTSASNGSKGGAPFFALPTGPYLSSPNTSTSSGNNPTSSPDKGTPPAQNSLWQKTPPGRTSSVRSHALNDSPVSGIPQTSSGGVGNGRIPRGIAASTRRRDNVRSSPSSSENTRSKSLVPGSTKSSRLRRSRSPTPSGGREEKSVLTTPTSAPKSRSRSPVPRTRSKSPLPRANGTRAPVPKSPGSRPAVAT